MDCIDAENGYNGDREEADIPDGLLYAWALDERHTQSFPNPSHGAGQRPVSPTIYRHSPPGLKGDEETPHEEV
jgi:hypothetical protein